MRFGIRIKTNLEASIMIGNAELLQVALRAYDEQVETAKARWKNGLQYEIEFWDSWIERDYGDAGALTYMIDPNRPFDDSLKKYINLDSGEYISVLDVGAGPITGIGHRLDEVNVYVYPIDPLADEYRAALKRKSIRPPVWTMKCDGEEILSLFGSSRFDFVHARNCLDHSYDPIAIFRSIATVLKTGCIAFLEHAWNEAEHEKYSGLHQWNFDARDTQFCVWREGVVINVSELLADQCKISADPYQFQGRTWVRTLFKKH